MWRTGLALIALSFAAVVGARAAVAELPAAIAQCAEVADDAERLSCYDHLNPPHRSGAAPASAPAEFGVDADLKRKREAAADASKAKEPDRIVAKVTRVSTNAAGQTLIAFDNGQVWQLTENRLATIAAPGDEVTLTRGSFGSYFLVSKSHPITRVRRVK